LKVGSESWKLDLLKVREVESWKLKEEVGLVKIYL
jgi:hypothetical protein